MDSILNQLMNYFENTSSEQLKKDWEDLDEWNKVGPTVDKYLEDVKCFKICDTVRKRLRLKKPLEIVKRIPENIYIVRVDELFRYADLDYLPILEEELKNISGVQVIVACDCNLRKEESWLEY
jgi:hypothetical protein